MKRKLVILLALFFAMIAPIRAQNSAAPIVMMMDGDLWSWDGSSSSLKQLTQWGYNQEMSLSPDGKRIAYTSLPQIVIESGGMGGGASPTNIWVIDTDGNNAVQITQQPPDASLGVQGVPDKADVRSKPAWSPDGTKLVWSEYDFQNDGIQRLVVYDFTTGATKTIVNSLPPQYGVPTPVDVRWTESGIVVNSFTMDSASPVGADDTFLVFSPDGQPLNTIIASKTDYLLTWMPVLYQGRDYIAGRLRGVGWNLFDLQTGQSQPAPLLPQPYNVLAPDMPPIVQIQHSPDEGFYFLQLLDAQGNAVGAPINAGYSLDKLALSPIDFAIALTTYNTQTAVYDPIIQIWRNGSVATSPTHDGNYITSFTWGPTGWRVNDPRGMCPGALLPRLTVGGQGSVIPGGGPNNVRLWASTSATSIGAIPENGTFTVSGGPVCDHGVIWWKVNYNGLTGWTAEGQNGAYFLEPG